MRNKTLSLIMMVTVFVLTIATMAQAAIIHTVKSKETLWKIAKEYDVSMEDILQANPELKNEKDLKQGSVLVIPEQAEEVIPLDNEATATHTLVVHGSGSQYQTPTEKNINIMTVNGKTIKVPTHKVNPVSTNSSRIPYPYKYRSKLSSRHRNISYNYTGGSGIVKTAFKYMGVPYVFGGSTPSGFDCSGFVQYVYRENGIQTPRMAHHQFYAGTPIKKSQLRPGDLVFFETYTVGISHVGIYIGNNNFIHASSSGSVRISCLGDAYYTNRYRGAARY